METLAEYAVGKLSFKIIFDDSPLSDDVNANQISYQVPAPEGYRIIGGGARIQPVYPQIGALLTAIYPAQDGSMWYAQSKDQTTVCAHKLTVFAVCVKSQLGPINDKDYTVVASESGVASNPTTTTVIPDGFTLVGAELRRITTGLEGNY